MNWILILILGFVAKASFVAIVLRAVSKAGFKTKPKKGTAEIRVNRPGSIGRVKHFTCTLIYNES
jgi:hypothetical protein